MNKLLAAIMLCSISMTSYAGNVEGEVGYASDYFFRGESQTMGGNSMQGWAKYSTNGFYAGTWVGQVDGIGEANYEYDLYAGYSLAVTDKWSVDGGVIQYRYDDKAIDHTEEWYVRGGNHWVQMGVYTDIDDSNRDYKELTLMMPMVKWVDLSLRHGIYANDDTYQMLTISKDIKGWRLGAEILDSARHGQVTDSASVFLMKTF
jgi:uncharacterized protein (TIGR02001 family)